MIRLLLRACGLATRGELQMTEEKLGQVRKRLEQAMRQLEAATATCEQLKAARRDGEKRHEARLASLVAEHERRMAHTVEAAAADGAKRVAALVQQLREREAQLEAARRDETDMERTVAGVLPDLNKAREQMAAVETKLDMLEGAANVLDARLRAAGRPGRDTSG